MSYLKNYIYQKFSKELKLLIYLTHDELKDDLPINLSEVDWDVFLDLAIKHRVVSHVLKHSTFLADHFPIPVYEKLMEIRLDRSKKALNFAIHAIRIHQQFKENNIPHCFFKGPLLSLELYKDIGYRNFRDIDVLVEKENAEKAKEIIEELNFTCIYPKIKLSRKQQKENYRISHHYHFKHSIQLIDVELHWNMTNPKSFLGLDTKNILESCNELKVSNYSLPYLATYENLVYQAAHGSIHQWYRLFWLKDFSVLLSKTNKEDLLAAFELSKKLKLEKCFIQALTLANLVYGIDLQEAFAPKNSIIITALQSINSKDLSQKGIWGKLRFIFYRLRLKKDFRYYIDLIVRLRTHLSDWEIIKINDSFFFLYYFLRPFLLIYKFIIKK